MKILLIILFVIVISGYFLSKDNKTIKEMNEHKQDFKKMNDDVTRNGLSESQLNQNIIDGKYRV